MTIQTLEELAEAVIISGLRRGESITVATNEEAIPPEAEAPLEQMRAIAQSMAETLRETNRIAEVTLYDLRKSREEINELLGQTG